MYIGTKEGDFEEINFVSQFNSNKSIYKDYLSKFKNNSNLWMVRVTTKQISKLCDKKVFTRSDCYLVNISQNIDQILNDNNYYISEYILEKNKIPYIPIPYSGISIKMTTSKNYQILKIGPNSFNILFNSYELGAGASLFCSKEEELEKNLNLIEGWKTSIDKMTTFFSIITKKDKKFYLNQQMCKNIKNYSCNKIKQIIDNSPDLQKKIFNGIGLYKEPYTAFYFYQGKDILKLETIPYNITTGSGRSKGSYTIVLKP